LDTDGFHIVFYPRAKIDGGGVAAAQEHTDSFVGVRAVLAMEQCCKGSRAARLGDDPERIPQDLLRRLHGLVRH
jgi:hypothetical protein